MIRQLMMWRKFLQEAESDELILEKKSVPGL